MKKNLLLTCMLFAFLAFFSCKSDSSDPGVAAQHFFTALYNKNFPEAKKYATSGSAQMIDMIATFNKNIKDTTPQPDIKLVVDQVKITGNTATARVTSSNNNNSVTAHLVKENDEWKVAFDKNSIMQMGGEVSNDADSLSPAQNEPVPDSAQVKP